MDACFASYKQLFADAYLHSYEQGEMAAIMRATAT